MILGVVAIILAPIAAQLIQLAISRRREFLADSSGALLTRYPEGLASALRKIAGDGRPMRRANHATAHLFIGDPFGSQAGKFVNKLFATHPPVEARVAALLGGSAK
jgi:heat shock protein HtpX